MKRLMIAAFIGAAVPAFAQTDPNPVVLNVNGDVIKSSEYTRRMETLPGVTRRIGNAALSYPPGFLTLEALITERLVFQLARQKNVIPTDAEVQAELATMLAENPRLLTDAALNGQTKADIEYQIKYNLAQFKLATFGITVTEGEVDNYYRTNSGQFIIPKRAKLSVIAVTDVASKSKIDAELAAGKPFAEVAKMYSDDLSKGNGGDFGTRIIGDMPKPIQDAINQTAIGKTTAWVEAGGTQVKFLLHDILPEERIPLDAKLRKDIRRRIMVQRGGVRNDVAKELNELRAKSKIDITNKTFADMYKRYMDEYNKKMGGGATPPPAP